MKKLGKLEEEKRLKNGRKINRIEGLSRYGRLLSKLSVLTHKQ